MTSVRWSALASIALAGLIAVGCGQKKTDETPLVNSETPDNSTPPPAAAPALNIDYASLDKGPRASASPVDKALAEKGKVLFTSKTCVACHKFDVKLIGPPLGDVPRQRTAQWMEMQMMHPDTMTANDPIAKALLAEYKTQMIVPGGVSEEEAKCLVEYIKTGGK